MAVFYNQAKLSYNGITTTSNIATGEVVEVLSMTKTSVEKTYEQNSQIRYVVSIQNSGDVEYSGLTLTDNLGAYAFNAGTLTPLEYVADTVQYYVNGILQTAPTVTEGPPLAFSNITVPAGGNAIVAYTASTNEYAPLDATGTIENTATLSGADVTSVTATATVTAEQKPLLAITKSVSPTTVTDQGQLTFTFTIQNLGNTAAGAGDNVVVTDEISPILSNLSVEFDSTKWALQTNYQYTEATGLFTSGTGQISVPAATYTQDATTGAWSIIPGSATLVIKGTV